VTTEAPDGAAAPAAPPPAAGLARRWRDGWRAGSGAAVGDLFRRVLAVIFAVAWLSLGAQVRLLIGARGLLPIADFVDAARAQRGLSFWDFPTACWWVHGDAALVGGVALGVLLAAAALLGWRPRLCMALSTALYLSYATAGRTFLSFQWDNLLLECGLLASFLPPGRGAPFVHLLFRFVLFKLYFESGIAKWQSPLHDWHDGSAMTYYYETAPLPTWIGLWAHNLPAAWHHFESRATLALELVVPFGAFGPRRARLGAAALLTGFQLLNVATANYGFFCYLALALHLFLLDDGDVLRAARWLRARAGHGARGAPPAPAPPPAPTRVWRRALAYTLGALFVLASTVEALFTFTEAGPALAGLEPILRVSQPLRLVNSYHLFAAITRDRVEPELQTSVDGGVTWTAHDLRHKPGDPRRAPGFVAPHQPRVDFQLWFYGLSFQRRQPAYVSALVGRLCEDPEAVQPLFRAPLPAHPDAVRIAYWQYHFVTPAERRATGTWWRRESIGTTRAIPCHR
jgi:hypothetical protein